MNKDSEKEETRREKEVFLKENNQKDASFFKRCDFLFHSNEKCLQ